MLPIWGMALPMVVMGSLISPEGPAGVMLFIATFAAMSVMFLWSLR